MRGEVGKCEGFSFNRTNREMSIENQRGRETDCEKIDDRNTTDLIRGMEGKRTRKGERGWER